MSIFLPISEFKIFGAFLVLFWCRDNNDLVLSRVFCFFVAFVSFKPSESSVVVVLCRANQVFMH